MKKTVTVNLNGRIFTMDEDAYQLLESYLHNLRIYFRKEDGASEIIADFEARIEELLHEKLRLGYAVITIGQVEEVIARMGKPADFADADDAREEETREPAAETQETRKKLFRNMQNKSVAGVCSGIAAYFGWDPTWVRLAFVVTFLLAWSIWMTGFILLAAYLLAWAIIPEARTAEEKLQMRGAPITVENIGKIVAGQTTPPPTANSGCLSGFLDVIVGIMKICLIGLACLIALPLFFVFGIVIIVLIAVLFGVGGGLLGGLLPVASAVTICHPLLASVTFILLMGIPLAALIYWCIARIAQLKPVHKSIKRTCLVVWLLALALFLCSGFRVNKSFVPDMWWNWSSTNISSHKNAQIIGNGLQSEKEDVIREPIEEIRLGNRLIAQLQIEQTDSDATTLLFSGDENLIANVSYEIRNRQLHFSAERPVRHKNNLIIRIQTPDLKKVGLNSAGDIFFPDTFNASDFEIKLSGAGEIRMNNLIAKKLAVDARGVGAVELTGKAGYAQLKLNGVGKINAAELVADTVYAHLNGVGSIRCNPSTYLNAHSNGVGEISYRDEPANKDIRSLGVSKIHRE